MYLEYKNVHTYFLAFTATSSHLPTSLPLPHFSTTTILTNLPPENRELFLINELRKIKNPFSLFRQRAGNFQISTIWVNALHWHMQNKFCLSKIGIARKYCISLEKENYNDIGTPLEFCQENDVRNMTLLQR